MGGRFEAVDEGSLLVPFDPRYTQVEFNSIVSMFKCEVVSGQQ